uniref:Uncharacterized protein n=1 Tax=Anguilla anguilla TaxID=7936 RepID=A0A0E9WTT9_ANGAN
MYCIAMFCKIYYFVNVLHCIGKYTMSIKHFNSNRKELTETEGEADWERGREGDLQGLLGVSTAGHRSNFRISVTLWNTPKNHTPVTQHHIKTTPLYSTSEKTTPLYSTSHK